MNYTTIGIDVSKAKLDIFFASTGEYKTLENNKKGFNELFKYVKRYCSDVERIIVEHTGSYQKELVYFLQKHNLPVCLIHPAKARNYAKAIGRLAKTDKIDAELLALYGEHMKPEQSCPVHPKIIELRDLVHLRRQLTDTLTLTKQWLEKNPLPQSQKRIRQLAKHLKEQIHDVESDILVLIKSEDILKKKFERLIQTKGIGKITVSVLLSELPELGTIEKNKVVSLCGLAPINRDSGTMRGKACIQGGRKTVRNALYMAIISAIKSNEIIHTYYSKLRQRGKPARVSIVAAMRKMIIHLNTELQKI